MGIHLCYVDTCIPVFFFDSWFIGMMLFQLEKLQITCFPNGNVCGANQTPHVTLETTNKSH